MAIDVLNTGTAAGSGDGESLRSAMTKVNSNFGVVENAASKIVQASSADTTADKVMLTDYAWRGAQLGDYFTYGGTANAITLTSANLRAGGTLIKGMKFRFEATATNTGATTIAVDGGSAIACVTPTGVALPAGFIRTDVFTECEYDGSAFVVSRKVESGSNSNGGWTRWEDGRQECSVLDVQCIYQSTSVLTYTWSYPVSFSSKAVCTPISADAGGNITPAVNEVTGAIYRSDSGGTSGINAVVEIRRFSGVSNFDPADYRLICISAVGKWY